MGQSSDISRGRTACKSATPASNTPATNVLQFIVLGTPVWEAEIETRETASNLTADVQALQVPSRNQPVLEPLNVDKIADTTLESTILDLAAKDKGAALVRLAIEIEKEMVLIYQSLGLEWRHPTWRELISGLIEKKVFTPELGKALIEFRDVRNKVIHSGFGGPVQDTLLNSVLDNGLSLYRLLKEIPRLKSVTSGRCGSD